MHLDDEPKLAGQARLQRGVWFRQLGCAMAQKCS